MLPKTMRAESFKAVLKKTVGYRYLLHVPEGVAYEPRKIGRAHV